MAAADIVQIRTKAKKKIVAALSQDEELKVRTLQVHGSFVAPWASDRPCQEGIKCNLAT